MKESIFRSFQRYLRANISFFYNKKEVVDHIELKLINSIYHYAKNYKLLDNKRKKKNT